MPRREVKEKGLREPAVVDGLEEWVVEEERLFERIERARFLQQGRGGGLVWV